MTSWKLIRRSLRFHARAHLGVVLGAAVGSATLIGALIVGDSVRESLRERALDRLGNVEFAVTSPDRFFRDGLRFELERELLGNSVMPGPSVRNWNFVSQPAAPTQRLSYPPPLITTAIRLLGTASRSDGAARANRVQILSVGPGLDQFASIPQLTNFMTDHVLLNESLAAQLRVKPGDVVIVRLRNPSGLSSETPLSPRANSATSLRLRVHSILTSAQLGNFDLIGNRTAPLNAFVRADTLQRSLGIDDRANMLLAGELRAVPLPQQKPRLLATLQRSWRKIVRHRPERPKQDQSSESIETGTALTFLDGVLQRNWKLADAELELKEVLDLASEQDAHTRVVELRSRRVFLDPPVSAKALAADTNSQPVLTYLANLLRGGTNTTPYSMVTAAGPPYTSANMRDDEIALSQWLADDLQVKPGDEVSLTYFEPESGARLVERTNSFHVRTVVPMELPWADRTLMPEFPGIEKAESTSDWDAGFPLVHKIRPKDEEYWKKYRGTPKAFVTLAAGKKMWANRFGGLTAIRFPVPRNAPLTPSDGERGNRPPASRESKTDDTFTAVEKSTDRQALSPLPGGEGQGEGERNSKLAELYRASLEEKILANLKPEELGLRFEPVREQALRAANQTQDFGQLFLGFSFFLIVAALVLMALLFQFSLEQRAAEVGTLLAIGFTPRQVRRLMLYEGFLLALLGGIIGTLGGIFYAKGMLHGLNTIWRNAVGASSLHYYATTETLLLGFVASAVVAALTIWLALRKQAKKPARALLSEGVEEKFQIHSRNVAGIIAALAIFGAATLVGWAVWKDETSAAGIFFSAGSLVLIGGLGFAAAWLGKLARRPNSAARMTLGGLGLRSSVRRRKRSLATIALLACGTFLIVAIGAFRLDANRDATKHSSGTGGFAMIGETALPVVHDLNSKAGREFFGLNANELAGVGAVQFRVREGDEASCLNLNRAQKPRLLGVKPEMLEGRFTFSKGAGWKTLISTRLQSGEHTPVEMGNRLSSFQEAPQPADTGLKPGANEIEISAIGDANSIQWALGKKIGDTIDYIDERGRPFKVRLVGAVANSILQGSLIIDEAEFVKRFPSESGYRMFLIDAPSNRVAEVSATLSRAMQDVGLELTPATRRLSEFNAVQNTYLSTFQVLGGLGLLLGSAGLGVVVMRNVFERRGEFGLMLAVGFRKRALQWLVLSEHGALLGLGLSLGIVAATVAILPSLLSRGTELPYGSLAGTLAAILGSGALWAWLATRFALRGNLLEALRNE